MSRFIGGSAYAMAQQVAEGHLLITERALLRLAGHELDQLGHEIDKRQRELRGEQFPRDDVGAIQARNRRLQRLNTTRLMVQAIRRRLRR